jgi:hypothetical protein
MLEAILGRLSLPRVDPGFGRLLGGAVADEAVAGGRSTCLVDAFGRRSAGHGVECGTSGDELACRLRRGRRLVVRGQRGKSASEVKLVKVATMGGLR